MFCLLNSISVDWLVTKINSNNINYKIHPSRLTYIYSSKLRRKDSRKTQICSHIFSLKKENYWYFLFFCKVITREIHCLFNILSMSSRGIIIDYRITHASFDWISVERERKKKRKRSLSKRNFFLPVIHSFCLVRNENKMNRCYAYVCVCVK